MPSRRLLVLTCAVIAACAALLTTAGSALAVTPSVVSVAVPADATYPAGADLDFTVDTDQAVTVDTTGGTPQIPVTLDVGGTVEAVYLSGSGTTELTFRYAVASGDEDSDGITMGSSIDLNGGTIQNAGLEDVDPTLNSVGSTIGVLVDGVAPTVSSVSVPADGTYILGQNLDFTVNWSENVMVDTTGGTPRIALTLDTGGTVYATYVSGSGTSSLTFRYALQAGDQDLTGITVGALAVNGGTIRDAAANDAVLTLNSVGSTAAVDVDGIVPTVSDVTVPSDGTYGAGQDLDFSVDLSQPVTVDLTGGTPYIQLTLDTGGTVDAAYLSGSGTSTLAFRYVVAIGNADANGITVGGSLFTNGGTIRNSDGNDVDTALDDVGSTANVDVEAIPPTATSIDRSGDPSTNNLSTEHFTVTFDKAVSGVDVTDFTVVGGGTASGSVTTAAGAGTTWTVTVGSIVGDGTLGLDLNTSGDPIVDDVGNVLTASHPGDQAYTVQHTPPSATGMTVPADGTYGEAQDMDFTVTYSEIVNVDVTGGTPRIPITLDTGGTVYADYLSGTGTDTLTFQYSPTAGVQDLTGIAVANAVDANGGTIEDTATNAANLAINTVEPSLAGVDVDAVIPVVDSVSVPGNATYGAGQALDFTANLNKPMTVDVTGGTPYVTVTLATGGTVDAAYVSGSGTNDLVFEYVVQPGEADADGVSLGGSMVLNGGTIDDAHGNAAALTLNSVGATTGVLVDSIAPMVSSIDIAGTSPTNATSLTYTATFSEGVTGVDAADFALTHTGSTTGTVSGVTPVSTSVYTVTVSGVTGDGTLRLDLDSVGTGIADLATNPIAAGFTGGETYTVDTTTPSVTSISRVDASPTAAASVGWTVTFSEPVTGVDAADFALTATGGAAGSIASVIPVSTSVYTVTANGLTGAGTLRLDLRGSGTGITDLVTNAIAAGFTTGDAYTLAPPTPTPTPTPNPTPTPITTPAPPMPSAPASHVTASIAGTRIVLRFGASTDNVVGYQITNGTTVTTTTSPVLSLSRTQLGTTRHDIFVRAVDAAGASSLPLHLRIVPLHKPVAVPTLVPAWAPRMLAWQHARVASRGPRPKGAPSHLPRWYAQWASWYTLPYSVTVRSLAATS